MHEKNNDNPKGRSLQELEQLEKDFRKALEGVCGERDRIVQGQLAKEEQRLCVVCQVNTAGRPDPPYDSVPV